MSSQRIAHEGNLSKLASIFFLLKVMNDGYVQFGETLCMFE